MIPTHKLSAFIRQTRYRAKKHGWFGDVQLDNLRELADNPCHLCDAPAIKPILAYRVSDGAPLCAANILVVCETCRQLMQNGTHKDLSELFAAEEISKDRYLAVIAEMVNRPGGEALKAFMRQTLGV